MDHNPLLRYVVAGNLNRSTILTPDGQSHVDVPGGALLYAGCGLALWEGGIGLVARVGEDYPRRWIEEMEERGFDCRGIHILPQEVDLRYFVSYLEPDAPQTESPVAQFSKLGLSYPRTLLGYQSRPPQPDSRTQPNILTTRLTNIPEDYLDVTAIHLGPMDYMSHSMLPSFFKHGRDCTITLDPGEGYMSSVFWDDIPKIVREVNVFITSEKKLKNLFQGRSVDLWEMAETIAGYGCEIVVVTRKTQGQMVYERVSKKKWTLPAYPVQPNDPTGAGDAFCGGYLAGLRTTYSAVEAALYGNISASFAVEGVNPFYGLDALHGLAEARRESMRGKIRKV